MFCPPKLCHSFIIMHQNKARGFLKEMLVTLREMHEKGIVHRNIKPHNIIFTKKGKYYLLDFGVASLGNNSDNKVKPVSPWYSPPEQLQGKATYRSDYYSLAITCYYLLFRTVKPTRPFQDQRLGEVLERMASPLQDVRYGSADEILKALEQPQPQPQPIQNPRKY